GKGHVPSAAAEVQHTHTLSIEKMRKSSCGASPPQTIDVEREQMVQQVIAWRNRGEHLAHGAGSRFWVCCSLWSRTHREARFGRLASLIREVPITDLHYRIRLARGTVALQLPG